MHIKLVNGETQHCDSAIGRALVAAKLAEEIPNTIQRPAPTSKWYVREGARVEDYQYPPQLCISCGCGMRQYTESEKGTAHKTAEARHCGIVDTCPANVAAQYEQIYAAWKSRPRKRAPEKVSAFTSNPRNLPLGLQTVPAVGK